MISLKPPLKRTPTGYPLSPFKIAVIYAAGGGLWILFSDSMLNVFLSDPAMITRVSILKGWVYVSVTAIILYWLIRRYTAERLETIRALGESAEYNRALYELSPIGLALCSMDGRHLDINPAYAKIIGRTVEETLQLSYWDITPERYAEQETLRLESLRISGRYGPDEKEYIHKDGHLVPVRLAGLVIERGGEKFIWSSVEDISERKRAEKALKESERKYRELVENANSIILRWSRDGTITFMNEFGQKFFGYSEAEVLGRHVVGTIVPETESTGRDLRPLIDRICANPLDFAQNINENMRRNGERVWISWTNRPVLDDQGQVSAVFSIGSDITERRRAEEAVRTLNLELEQRIAERTADLENAQQALLDLVEDLNRANDRLKELDRLKSMFIASMSHELRTPLNSIIGFTGIILQGMVGTINDEQRDQLERVFRAGKHLLALITDVIDIAKIESGKIQPYPEDFVLDDIIDEACAGLKPQIVDKGLTLTKTVPTIPIRMRSDRRRLLQCLLNFLSNAIKFSEQGTITIAAREKDGYAVVDVSDTGIGIRRQDLPLLFKSFVRLESPLKATTTGTGLGLYLTRKLAGEVLAGEVGCESREGEGSRFWLRVPLRLNDK